MDEEMNASSPLPRAHNEGFASVAKWMSLDPNSQSYIYRQFSELGARNLLYLQCELLVLEKNLRELDITNANTNDLEIRNTAKAYMDLIMELRSKLKKYQEVLILQSEISKLQRPRRRSLNEFRDWFLKPFPVLWGTSKNIFDDLDDLVSIRYSPGVDLQSEILHKHWLIKAASLEILIIRTSVENSWI
ncbi:hypothetical protein BJX70DRAFT_195373 [Aspergillus crustosus]